MGPVVHSVPTGRQVEGNPPAKSRETRVFLPEPLVFFLFYQTRNDVVLFARMSCRIWSDKVKLSTGDELHS